MKFLPLYSPLPWNLVSSSSLCFPHFSPFTMVRIKRASASIVFESSPSTQPIEGSDFASQEPEVDAYSIPRAISIGI